MISYQSLLLSTIVLNDRDASSIGIGAVLEQDSYVIAYASRALTKSEKQYSVIQRECLALVYALKQFCHYLLGRSFTLVTDHAPLQWLSAQKMEGLLCRWSLALQEYDFQIKYRKGIQNGNADALSRCMETLSVVPSAPTVILPNYSVTQMKLAQEEDPIIKQLQIALDKSPERPSSHKWNILPFIVIDSCGLSLNWLMGLFTVDIPLVHCQIQ